MADSTVNDISKMRVVDLRKELKSRGLSYTGDKAELINRLETAMAQDHADINLDSDEIDSDAVLDDEDDKTQNDENILGDCTVDSVSEGISLADVSPEKQSEPLKKMKRKISNESQKEPDSDNKDNETKTIVLNRTMSMNSSTKPVESIDEKDIDGQTATSLNNKIKITADLDMKTRLELRAKRFGIPVKIPDVAKKEVRMQRFGKISSNASNLNTSRSISLSDNLEKLKKRSERFGQSVSSLMGDIELKERLERRKEKFGKVK
ncbi:SAP domain-containing ribonucleoprotein [Leptidea sinapis]|uniref:SAP domain-containing ribonucleoprotein n=1 Tax=Leptidea sinapis TaxID=189913 RepID=UPI0021C2C6A4|nr:SAP domain-containing ribonucleoprotein [Leptidea sinapis]